MARIDNFISNAKWKTCFQILTSVLNLLNRYAFMHWMGAEYLGATSLFNSVLGVLSFADLGLTGAFSVCFYKAVAEKDSARCVSLLNVLRRIMCKCVLVMMGAGVLLTPLIPLLATQTQQISNGRLCICYVLFLLEIGLGYLYASKECYVTARQQEYIIMPLTTAWSALKVALGLLIIYVFRSYEGFLVSGIIITFLQRICLNIYIGKRYPETRINRAKEKLDQQDKAVVLRNVKASLNYKIAGVCVSQTDSILLSFKTGIIMTGVVSNYVAIKSAVYSLLNLIASSFTPSLGNVLVVETPKRQLEIYHTFLSLQVFLSCGGFITLSMFSTPIVALLFGKEACVDQNVVLVMNAAVVIMVFNNTLNTLSMAAGNYHLGINIVWLGAVVNLLVSWIAVNHWGVLGVYIGTLVSELLIYVLKPFVVMNKMYGALPQAFFRITVRGMAVTAILYSVLWSVQKKMFSSGLTWGGLGAWTVICMIIFMGGYSFCTYKDPSYRAVLQLLKGFCVKWIRKYRR